MVELIVALVFLLAIAIPSYFIVRKTLKNKPLVDAAKARFAEQVGYPYGGP